MALSIASNSSDPNGGSKNLDTIKPGAQTSRLISSLDATSGGIALAPNGITAYVSESGNNTVAFVHLPTRTVTAHVPVGEGPGPLVVAADGHTVYVANTTDKSVSIVNITTRTATTVALPDTAGTPTGLDVTPDGGTVYVAAGTEIYVIDTASHTDAPTAIDPFGSVFGLAVSPDGRSLFMTLDHEICCGRSISPPMRPYRNFTSV